MHPRRNVEVLTSDGVTAVGGIYQYGHITCEMFYNWLQSIISSNKPWLLCEWDEITETRGQTIASTGNANLIQPGVYVIVGTDGNPVQVVSSPGTTARIRHPTVSNTATRSEHYQKRVRERDPCCLISGLHAFAGDSTRLKAAHIFPRAHDIEWNNRGFPLKITDPAPLNEVGGPSKIDSLQNILLLRSDLHDAWDNYCCGVNVDDGYRIVPFIGGYSDIAGMTLKLDHIQDDDVRPLDDLLRDHFFQGVRRHMKGGGDGQDDWDLDWDFEDAFGGTFDFSREV